MPWTTLNMQVTTPLFNGGADPTDESGLRSANEPGLRVASIRGAMRFWFRALAGAFTGPDLALLAAMERRVFGGISGKAGDEAAMPSPLVLRLPDPPKPDRSTLKPAFLKDGKARGIVYLLGLGLMEMKDTKPQLTRYCVLPDPGHTFKLMVRFQHDRRATDDVQRAVEALAYASLWLACTYGGFGARTRRGFGGVRILSGEGDLPVPWKSIKTYGVNFYEKSTDVWPQSHVTHLLPHLRALAAAERRELPEIPHAWTEPPPFPVLSQRFAPATLGTGKFESWETALNYAGLQLRNFRANNERQSKNGRSNWNTAEWEEFRYDDASERFPLGALGLPVVFHDKDKDYSVTVNAVDQTTDDHAQLRRASPLWLRPVGDNPVWRLYSYAFQGRFLPDDSEVQVRLLPDAGAMQDDWTERDLTVDADDVLSLTNQWITTMRAGGDFRRVIRQ
jgi:hypothetical protein